MQITSINIKLALDEEPVKAYCSVVFDNCFIVRKIRIIERKDKFQIFMPSMKTKNNNYADVCHPINHQFRKKIEKAILEHYSSMIENLIVPDK